MLKTQFSYKEKVMKKLALYKKKYKRKEEILALFKLKKIQIQKKQKKKRN